MAGWYVRDRGRVIGPLSTDQVLDLRDRGQLHGYHEVSADRRTWRAVDLVPELSNDAPPPPPDGKGGAGRPRPAPPPPNNRTYALVVGGVVSVLLLGGIVIAAVVYLRGGRGGDSTVENRAKVSPGVITFAGHSEKEQGEVFRQSVGLVITGLEVTYTNNKVHEVDLYTINRRSTPAAKTAPDLHKEVLELLRIAAEKGVGPEGQEDFVRKVTNEVCEFGAFGTGSGFCVTPDGYFLTNKHVIAPAARFARGNRTKPGSTWNLLDALGSVEPRIWVFFGRDERYQAKLVRESAEYDMAILKLDRPAKHVYALGASDPKDIPQLSGVSSLGFPGIDRAPLGVNDRVDEALRQSAQSGQIQLTFPDRAFDFSWRRGDITKRAFQTKMREDQRESWILLHSAQIAGGNSGGPLIAKDGTVIGINTWSGKAGPNQNYALTLSQLRGEIDAVTGKGVTWRELPK